MIRDCAALRPSLHKPEAPARDGPSLALRACVIAAPSLISANAQGHRPAIFGNDEKRCKRYSPVLTNTERAYGSDGARTQGRKIMDHVATVAKCAASLRLAVVLMGLLSLSSLTFGQDGVYAPSTETGPLQFKVTAAELFVDRPGIVQIHVLNTN